MAAERRPVFAPRPSIPCRWKPARGAGAVVGGRATVRAAVGSGCSSTNLAPVIPRSLPMSNWLFRGFRDNLGACQPTRRAVLAAALAASGGLFLRDLIAAAP